MTTTVRRTSTKRLNALLADAALITKYRAIEAALMGESDV